MIKSLAIIFFIAGLLLSASTLVSIRSNEENTKKELSNNSEASLPNPTSSSPNKFQDLLNIADKEDPSLSLSGQDANQINILFLGIGGEEHISGNYLTDTIILITYIPSTQKTSAISIPRDLLVSHPMGNSYTKINALYAIDKNKTGFPGPMGIDYAKDEVQNISGLEIHYYAVLDLAGVEQIVDILGGINIRRTQDLDDFSFPDDARGYDPYSIDEGWRYLNGEEATKYIRTRHTAGGDFDRMKRQQEVAVAIKNKISGLKSVSGLPKLLSLYNALQDHFTTDLTFSELMKLMELGGDINSENVIFDRITAEPGGLLIYDRIKLGGVNASVLRPKSGTGNYTEIKNKISNIINGIKN
jgi:polyisoprenyl-teichoic acid--peptidoglycan teichoic acid transferase